MYKSCARLIFAEQARAVGKNRAGFYSFNIFCATKKKQQTTLIFQTEHRAQRHGAEYILIPAVAQATTLLTYTYQTVNLYGRAFLGSKK